MLVGTIEQSLIHLGEHQCDLVLLYIWYRLILEYSVVELNERD